MAHAGWWPARLASGLSLKETHVWRVALDGEMADRASWSLSGDERQRAARFQFPRDRRRFEAARAALRAILSGYLGESPTKLRFEYGAYGKPALGLPTEITFNLSHCREVALVAVARGRAIGVDIERVQIEVDFRALARTVFSDGEQATLDAIAGDAQREAFFRGWVRKEAFVKARGEGLSLPIREIEVSLALDAALLTTPHAPCDARGFVLYDLDVMPGYVAALAVERGCERLACFDFV
jgi:4'-phosphopantetheinyl transferase